jgi:hypothetical protein
LNFGNFGQLSGLYGWQVNPSRGGPTTTLPSPPGQSGSPDSRPTLPSPLLVSRPGQSVTRFVHDTPLAASWLQRAGKFPAADKLSRMSCCRACRPKMLQWVTIAWRLIDADTAHLNKSCTSPLLPSNVAPLSFCQVMSRRFSLDWSMLLPLLHF